MEHQTEPVFSIVVPAHNESENLSVLLPRLAAALSGVQGSFEILLVDNASTDDTPRLIAELAHTIPQLRLVLQPVLGYGRAVLSGLVATRGSYIGIIRADNQEKPEDLRDMCNEMQERKLDFFKAIRAHRTSDGVRRIIISLVYNSLFKILFQTRSRDLNATPKVFTRAFYEAAHLESVDWFIDAEMVLKAEYLGLRVGEREIEYLPRLKGASNVRVRHIFEFLGNMLQWRTRLYRGTFLEK